jgi:hypothetical protein
LVISHYDQRDREPLRNLIASIEQFDAGREYDVCIVVNRDRAEGSLDLGIPRRDVTVLERENLGMNIGAWDHAWRTLPEYDSYLFLQDDCYVRRAGWLAAFLERANETGVGLVGESRNENWNQSWDALRRYWQGHVARDHLLDGAAANKIDVYFDFFARKGIPRGTDGSHLRALVWNVTRTVLERIHGFPIGHNYGECIAAEIGVSKYVQSLGLRTVQVSDKAFSCIGHREWVWDDQKGFFVHQRTMDKKRLSGLNNRASPHQAPVQGEGGGVGSTEPPWGGPKQGL